MVFAREIIGRVSPVEISELNRRMVPARNASRS
jgi:hypothetical protein